MIYDQLILGVSSSHLKLLDQGHDTVYNQRFLTGNIS